MNRALAILILLLLIFRCEERKWTNIYDPGTTVDPAEWAPENFGIIQISDAKVKLTWEQRDPRIEGIMVDRQKGNGDWKVEYAVLDSSLRAWIDTVSFDGSDYQYRIYNYAGMSRSTSLENSISLDFPAVKNFSITHNSETSAMLHWSDHVFTEFEYYLIERRIDDGLFSALDSVISDVTEYTDNTLSPDRRYSYRIFAVTKRNRSAESDTLSIIWTTTVYNEIWGGTHLNTINQILFSNDGSYLVSVGNDSAINAWDAETGSSIWSGSHPHAIKSVDINKDDNQIATAGGTYNAGEFSCWSSSGALLWTSNQAFSMVNDIEFSPNGSRLATASNDRYVRLCNVTDGSEIWSMHYEAEIWNVRFDPFGLYVAAGGWFNGVKILNITDGSQYRSYSGSPYIQQVADMAFNSDGSRLATVGSDWFLQVWDLDKGFVWKDQHEGVVNTVDFSPDDNYVVSGGNDFLVRMWKTDDGTALWQGSHTSNIVDVQFSPEGLKVVSASYDNTIKVWDAISGTLLWTGQHNGPVTTVDFGGDGAQLASGDNMGIVKAWQGQKTWYVTNQE